MGDQNTCRGLTYTDEALYFFAQILQDKPQPNLLYADHDYQDSQGTLQNPCFKPDWNPDMFTSTNYIQHPVWIRDDVLKDSNGWCPEYAGAMDYELLLRLTRGIKQEQVLHVHRALAHLRAPRKTCSTCGKILTI